MGDLDKKLTNLIESYHGNTDKFISNVKQAFLDNGYVRTVIMNSHTIAMNGKDPLGWIVYYPNEAMTGQEWYDQFSQNMADTVSDGFVGKGHVWYSDTEIDLAAKQAAGLTA